MKYTLKNTLTLLEAVMEAHKGISRQKAKQIISYSSFLVNGKKTDRHAKNTIQAGSILEIIPSHMDNDAQKIPGRKDLITIYFEDNFLIVGLKPAGVLSCGNKEAKINNSYHKWLEAYLSEREQKKIRLWVVHRLDKEVEGLIIFARSEIIQQKFKDIWKGVSKKYIALTENKPDPPEGIIENWLIDTPSQKVYAYDHEVTESKFARTHYSFLRNEDKYSVVEIVLDTGRKNQIRVHMAGINCPIVGDIKYGADTALKRQIRLAAYKLNFIHPVSSQSINLQYKPSVRFFKPSKNQDENYKVY
ncbi:MAG: RluA family pseudouridine synthase [Bacteroidota bacterium]